ncbi:MAG: tRNA (N6-threonylcarbamoyladenosine(37)-N6)-methyltransferase TrmO [Bdellovibrionales bacterium RIFCSPHIGHO2_01_FULL_40_29]|nr:MAG: tRNA (N6-threonylcarbamoyladenosine(37)-N6)-methyltransferase TrmO [Bdellovibrionales bacterium RIFCSPHIGHO2_01_FULL_40_29]OFZ34462.1 MAG: tRNA (N6-threonylcarbamoyladenosine(37)-N6)-methyltransferase TrmO [Bdellovibrionales bacterium RIFCSPHIGHO2_02_FULL_40_15]
MNPLELVLKPIGFIKSSQIEPYQAARQPDELSESATLMLQGPNFIQAVQDLSGCSHVWLIFGFHHNQNWKPLVQTPRSDRKIGVFATRAPYRPNPLGLTCVQLLSVHGTELQLGPNDLLDGTPIYDIKPYLAESDRLENTSVAWLGESIHPRMNISFSPSVTEELDFLEINGLKELRPFILRQLEFDPINSNKKRVALNSHFWTLSYRTWRIDFLITEDTVGVVGIRSGYSEQDLQSAEDTYQDKELHRKFNRQWGL